MSLDLTAERAKDALFSVMRDGRELELWSDELTADERAALSPDDLARAEADERRWEALHCAAEDAAAERRRQADALAFVDDPWAYRDGDACSRTESEAA